MVLTNYPKNKEEYIVHLKLFYRFLKEKNLLSEYIKEAYRFSRYNGVKFNNIKTIINNEIPFDMFLCCNVSLYSEDTDISWDEIDDEWCDKLEEWGDKF